MEELNKVNNIYRHDGKEAVEEYIEGLDPETRDALFKSLSEAGKQAVEAFEQFREAVINAVKEITSVYSTHYAPLFEAYAKKTRARKRYERRYQRRAREIAKKKRL